MACFFFPFTIEQSVIPAKGEHDEVDAVDDPTVGSSALRDDGGVHDMVPILLGEHLNNYIKKSFNLYFEFTAIFSRAFSFVKKVNKPSNGS